ncbi:MFS transporter [Streptomyces sp. HNM0574]|uniref:MFS transporter n=1 Tax=Streptomyces sp. HNM0574 TaxID=2714954 RepID=UPI00146E9660|nr:MFS transporter [Streptomyces sp. HNM0574]NLU68330.1 MHS family MFS transporter [Streptomyces sp. HNM0574]
MANTPHPHSPDPAQNPDPRAARRRVATATIVGSALEWYDFYLYAAMAALVFGKIFFPQTDATAGTLAAFATFAAGFLARPFGGILFGHLADRIGRRNVLIITFILMGVSTGLIGLLPTYGSVGVLAPVALVVLRILQGLGSGAEYSSAAVVAYEHADDGRRGRQGAWPALGLNLGLLLSSLTVTALTGLSQEALLTWGWRIPFVASFALAGVGLWVRRRVPESPGFQGSKRQGAGDGDGAAARQIPFVSLIRRNRRGLLAVLAVALGYNALSYIFKTFSMAYLSDFQDVPAGVGAFGITLASAAAIFTVPLFGWASDRFGSRRVLVAGGIASALFAFPFFMLLDTRNTTAIWVCLVIATGVLAPAMFAPQGSFLSRQFPSDVRVSGVGTGREFGGAVSGGLAPLAALAIVGASTTHATWGVSLLLVAGAVVVVLGAALDQGARRPTPADGQPTPVPAQAQESTEAELQADRAR